MTAETVEITVNPGVIGIDAGDWDGLACPEAADGTRPLDPFTTHRFLSALERSHSVGPGTGWTPRILTARAGGRLIGAAPCYLKDHSQGEYIFDHSWARAYENAGGSYYPKLQIAVPFTPATGRRFLAAPGEGVRAVVALSAGAVQMAEAQGLSSLHITFCTEPEAIIGEEVGLLRRTSQQFHWFNDGYGTYDDFLATLASRKRKALRKERDRAQAFGGTIRALTGDQIEPRHWDAFWRFYQDTGNRKWGRPYLTRAFFDEIHATMRDDVLLVLAERDGRPVAGALNFLGRDCIYGRYWGCIEEHPFLHFELCYHQAIDWAIAHGLARVEAGAQGEHKLARGYQPVLCHSLHWMADAGLHKAVARYLEQERQAVDQECEVLTSYGPFRRGPVEDEGD